MYQKADDTKNDMILNVLAWVDHIKPKYCVFENVKGFLNYRIITIVHSTSNFSIQRASKAHSERLIGAADP